VVIGRRQQAELPAEVEYSYTVESSHGPLESAKIRCPRGHWFNGPIDLLILREPGRRGPGRLAGMATPS